MKHILSLVALLSLASPAFAVTQMSGWITNTTCPMLGGGITVYYGTGPSVIADNVPDDTYQITALCQGDYTPNWPNPHTVQNQRFKVFKNGAMIFDDFAATYTVTRGNDPDFPLVNGVEIGCQTQVVITGSSAAGTYTVTITNPHIDSLGRLVYDFSLTAQPNVIGGGQGGGDDPPIIHH